MRNKSIYITMDDWINQLRNLFRNLGREYSDLFEIYAAEARFGRRYIAKDLELLSPGAKILEVGAGSMILSCQLVNEGYRVTAIEPIETGFSHFNKMQTIILEQAKTLQCIPDIIGDSAEKFNHTNEYNYAFSINVMEHVEDVSAVLTNIGRSLVAGACYRFTCPNYLFPYEPHFNIPTLFTKPMTEKIFRKKIFENRQISDPSGLWNSLNWITVSEINRYSRKNDQFKVSFGGDLILTAIERVASDVNFSNRRSLLVRILLQILYKSRIYLLFQFIPVFIQPIIDCRLKKVI